MIMPILERPDAEGAPERRHDRAHRLDRRQRPVRGGRAAAGPERPLRDLRLGVGDAAARPAGGAAGHALRVDDGALPMLRAVKDAEELERLAAAGAAADACSRRSCSVRFAGRTETRGRRRPGRPARLARPLAGRLHRGRLRAQRCQPTSRDGRSDHRGGRHGRPRLRRAQGRLRLRHDAHRPRRRADRRGARGLRHRPPRPAGGLRGRAAGRRVPGDRPRRAAR